MKIETGKKNELRYARIEHSDEVPGKHEVLVWKLDGELLFDGKYDSRAEALANLKCRVLKTKEAK